MDRRDFIRDACTLCIVLGGGIAIGSLSSCSTLPAFETESEDGRVRVPVSAFGGRKVIVVRVRSLMYDLALVDRGDDRYDALLLRCTHAETQLTMSGDEFTCSEHGSRFDSGGKVKKGPARKDLVKFPAETIGAAVIVQIPASLLH